MSLPLLILIIFAVVMLGGAVYSLKMALDVCCPRCIHEGEEEKMIPIAGPLLWWCLACDGKFGYSDALRTQRYEEEEQAEREFEYDYDESDEQGW